jgi:hypothetical protein
MATDLVTVLYPAVMGRAKTRLTDVEADCIGHIGATQRDLTSLLGMSKMTWLRKDYTLTTVASTHTYDLATLTTDLDGRQVLGLYPQYRTSPLEEVDSGKLFVLDPDATMAENKPERWAWVQGDAQTVKLQPTPDDAYTLLMPYFRKMTYATSASTGNVDWPDDAVGFLIEHAAYLARKWNRRVIPPQEEVLHQQHLRTFLNAAVWRPPQMHMRPRGATGLRSRW